MQEEAKSLELYSTMSRIRAFEKAVVAAVMGGELPGSSHVYTGEEAVAAGVCGALREEDRIISTYRGHGHGIAMGCDINAMMAEVYGKAEGTGHGRMGSLHLSDPEKGVMGALAIVAGGSPVSVGVAYAQKAMNTGGVTVVFFGDGASDRGTQHEAMNLAALWKLPVIFVVENNGVAYFTMQDRHQSVKDISVRAAAYDMKGMTVDGNDVDAVFAATEEAVAWSREGNGPVLLELKTYRFDGHSVGDPAPYRDPEVTQRWMDERDPLALYAEKLVAQGIDEEKIRNIDARNEEDVARAVAFAREGTAPSHEALEDVTYVNRWSING